uniref:Secreted protein n=1 Tax=Panagrellus redivivus TaxID=6233 RepID=A0A7E4VRF1_PANRE
MLPATCDWCVRKMCEKAIFRLTAFLLVRSVQSLCFPCAGRESCSEIITFDVSLLSAFMRPFMASCDDRGCQCGCIEAKAARAVLFASPAARLLLELLSSLHTKKRRHR